MNPETPLVSAGIRPYYGNVTFTGTVSLNYSADPANNVYVELLEDGTPRDTDYTDSNGDYELQWNIQRLKLYSLRISKSGYKTSSKYLIATSANHEEDRTLYGRAALFIWAPDVANQTIIQELGDQLVDEEGFTDILYYENATDWEDTIDELDALETYHSQVFVYIIGHGDDHYVAPGEYVSEVYQCGQDLEDTYSIASDDLADKLQDLDSQNIFLIVEACYSIGFAEEYEDSPHDSDPVFVMTSSNLTASAMWFGDNGTRYNPNDPDEGAYGGAFTHFFFEGLDLDKTDIQAFNYAYNNANWYAWSVIKPTGLDQHPRVEDLLTTTWF